MAGRLCSNHIAHPRWKHIQMSHLLRISLSTSCDDLLIPVPSLQIFSPENAARELSSLLSPFLQCNQLSSWLPSVPEEHQGFDCQGRTKKSPVNEGGWGRHKLDSDHRALVRKRSDTLCRGSVPQLHLTLAFELEGVHLTTGRRLYLRLQRPMCVHPLKERAQ